ncbi:uncharacterized protein [Macaca fascicularis]|uniref:uncharacterized protein n=1 Tax=Macaca fascicularis TaxID=9541 RepID=UPI003D15BC6B
MNPPAGTNSEHIFGARLGYRYAVFENVLVRATKSDLPRSSLWSRRKTSVSAAASITVDLGKFSDDPDKHIDVLQDLGQIFSLTWRDVMLLLDQTLAFNEKNAALAAAQEFADTWHLSQENRTQGATQFAPNTPFQPLTGATLASPVPAPSPPPEKAAEGRGAVRADTAGARVPAPRVRAAGAARPHLPCKDPATHPNDVPLRPSRRHRRLFRPLRTPLFATAPFAAAVAAVLAAAPAAAARVRFHALRRGRARATARWRHLATDRSPAAGSRGAGLESRLRRLWRLFRTGSTRCPSRAGGPRVWLPCRHLAPGQCELYNWLFFPFHFAKKL